jgi:hypothetical protein
MQQPTDGFDMMTVCNEESIAAAPCEKITLFRHAILLSKILLSYTFQPSIDQATALLPHIHDQFHCRGGNNDPDSPALRQEKDKEDMIEKP